MLFQVPIACAQYLRVSTGRQECSLQTQVDAIAIYAQQHRFQVVETYVDIGSGLTIRRRPQLSRLLQTILGGGANFATVLVYDVSRWGRFQDSDEAAHYEYICKQSGIAVHYCAEPFTNDSSFATSIIKALKRSMAAEYSRELSDKCFAGAKRVAELGYKLGGLPGYGLRRLMISAHGTPKHLLKRGDVKGLRTDRVILVLGPPKEIETVREIYRMVVEEHKSAWHIARELQLNGVPPPTDRWRPQTVQRILTDPKYTGANVWNRTTRRLGARAQRVERSRWVTVPSCFDAIIDADLFERTQSELARLREPYSRQELLEKLRHTLRSEGCLSLQIVRKAPDLPSITTFIHYFGTIRRAFELAGQEPRRPKPPKQTITQARAVRTALVDELVYRFPTHATRYSPDNDEVEFVVLDKIFPVAIIACPAVRRNRRLEWYVEQSAPLGVPVTLLARLNTDNSTIKDLLLVHSSSARWIRRVTDIRGCRQFMDISQFYGVATTSFLDEDFRSRQKRSKLGVERGVVCSP